MKVVAISDTHCRHRSLSLPKGDAIVHAGDVTQRGRPEELLDFLSWFAAAPYKHKIFIGGNHDAVLQKLSAEELKKIIPDGVIYLMDSEVIIDGVKVWGSPYTTQPGGWSFYKKRGKELTAHWQRIPPDVALLVTHLPPYGMMDVTGNEQHVGDPSLLKRVLEVQPQVHLFGHIHESYGAIKRKGVWYVNACMLNDSNEQVHQPIVVDVQPRTSAAQAALNDKRLL